MTSQPIAGSVPQWTLGDRLRKAREEAKFRQEELADTIGISRRSVSAYESGDSTPRRPTILAWSLATGVSQRWLQTGEAGDPEEGLGKSGEGVRHQGLEPRTRWFRVSLTSSDNVIFLPQRPHVARHERAV